VTKAVALYARVSSDEQREQQTIKTQLDYARGRAHLEGWTLRAFSDEGVSGTKPFGARRGGRELLEAVRAGEFDLVVSYRVDRLGRDLRVVLDAIDALKAAGASFRSLTEPFEAGTPFGDAALGMAGIFAQLELNTLKQRMRDGKKRVATYDNRRLTGVVPYGYARGEEHRLVIDPIEASVVRQIYDWAIAGWTHIRIAKELRVRGTATHSAGPGKRKRVKLARWERPAVSRILRSELYAGRAVFFKTSKVNEPVYRNMPAIVSPATFLAARQATAAGKQFGGTHQSRKHDYRLRGLVRCGRCGHTITGRQWGDRHGYYCHYCPAGQKLFVDEAPILEILWRDVLEFLANPDATLRALAQSASEAGTNEDRAEHELLALAQKLREFDFKEAQLVEMRLARTISPQIYEAKFKAISAERAQVRMQMDLVRQERATAARAVEESEAVRSILGQLHKRAVDSGADPASRTEIVRVVTTSVAVIVTNKKARLHVTYAFGRAVAADVEAMESTLRSTSRPALGRPSEHRAR
jgi:site-specific DNA recombinase